MTKRIYNFGAGPAMLPESILKNAQEELLNWHNTGMSIMEVGHRTPEFTHLLEHAEHVLRQLLTIPDDYQVLFLGGAARTQFSMIPMNFLQPEEQAAYLVTGVWSQMALEEAQKLKKAYGISSIFADSYNSIPERNAINLQNNTSYLYYTPNETVNGIRFPYVPKTNGIPLIADMTSCLLSEPIDVKQYGLIFAGAQKNIANAGLTVVIIRNDLLDKIPNPIVPSMLHYKLHADHHSLYATPPVFNCYMAALMFDWIKEQGGIEALFQQNCFKAAKLYQYLDSSEFYTTEVLPEARSIVNICFSMQKETLIDRFIQLAEQQGLCALKGHRLIGGLRASLYNAMPISGVDLLIEFMDDFAKEYN
ncbi:MAG: 3-phosphoserine/phosphohydroxythreonine transaminase [bacterium]|nr:3-phosphoserine/phosphohydroxythreonine transaminase [bacterium]